MTQMRLRGVSPLVFGSMTGLLFSLVISQVSGWGISSLIALGPLFVVVGALSKNAVDLTVSILTGFTAMSLVVLILEKIPVIPPISPQVLGVLTALCVLGSAVANRRSHSTHLSVCWRLAELFVLGIAAVLVMRWPVNGATQSLGFLSYEDNSAWISTAASFQPQHLGAYTDGAGGFVLDPLMCLVHFGISTFSHNGSEPSLAYVVTARTYALIEFLAVLSLGTGVLRLMRERMLNLRLPVSLISATAAGALGYVSLQFPRSTGHLTFIGALMFIWGMMMISPRRTDKTTFSFSTILLVVGMVGMWWPLVLVAVALFVLHMIDSGSLKAFLVRSATATLRWKLLTLVGVVGISFSAWGPLTVGFRSMSIRQFFSVQGGVQPVPGNSLIVALLTLGVLDVCLGDLDLRPRGLTGPPWMNNLILLGGLTGLLYIVSNFVGPEFAQKYTVLKVLLLFVLATVPLAPVAVGHVARSVGHFSAPILSCVLIFGVGLYSVGWNLNDPRSVAVPTWGPALLATADKYPTALIVCSTSDPAHNMDAYLCSRHAAALQYREDELAQTWRYLQLFPQQSSTEDLARATQLAEMMQNERYRGSRIIVLSLETNFRIADEDKWWMSLLPLDLSQVVEVGR